MTPANTPHPTPQTAQAAQTPQRASSTPDGTSLRPLVGHHHRTMDHRFGFWATSIMFLVLNAFNTLPTPLYAQYQLRDGFPTAVVTIIFSIYSIGVMLSLYLFGHVSDWMGRRRMVLIAALLQLIAAAIFIARQDVAGLLVARFVAGFGVGMLNATVTAHLAEMRKVSHPQGTATFAATTAAIGNLGGLALGPIIGGMFAEWAHTPLVTPYVVFLIVMAIVTALYVFVPETVRQPEQHIAYHPQHIVLPQDAKGRFWAGIVGAFVAFATTGFGGSITPTFLAQQLHMPDHLLAGLASFAILGASVIGQLAFIKLRLRTQVTVGAILTIAGMLLFAAADLSSNLWIFLLGSVVAGMGVGVIFRSAMQTAAEIAPEGQRGAVTAAMYIGAFAGMTIVPVLIGVSLLWFPLVPTFFAFVIVMIALIAWAGPVMRGGAA